MQQPTKPLQARARLRQSAFTLRWPRGTGARGEARDGHLFQIESRPPTSRSLLTILSSDQTDLLVSALLQRQPALAELLLRGAAAEPTSAEEAAVRVLSDGAEVGVRSAEVGVRSYLEMGSTVSR